MIVNMLEFLLSTLGLTFIVVFSFIFKGVRDIFKNNKILYKLINCPQCFGFWSGILIKTLLLIYYSHVFVYVDVIILFIYGLISSFISYVIYLLLKYFMDKYD